MLAALPLALAIVVAAQTTAPASSGTPPWVTALVGAAIAIGSAVAGWFGAKTKAEKSTALANTINAIPTAWFEVLKANPNVPNGALIGDVLKAAAAFAGRALTAAEESAARAAVEQHTPVSSTLLATSVAADIAKKPIATAAVIVAKPPL